jgi:hypothetical protein
MDRGDLANLTAFVAVADQRSFRAAASRVGVTPSALSDPANLARRFMSASGAARFGGNLIKIARRAVRRHLQRQSTRQRCAMSRRTKSPISARNPQVKQSRMRHRGA